ncbi:MAG: hypothetical protein ACP5VQ_01405 [Phycisphaerae bacterium]
MAKNKDNSVSPAIAPEAGGESVRPVPTRVLRGEEFLIDAESAEQIASLAYTGATDGEIADYLELSVSVIRAKFGKQLKRGRASMHIGLRKKQIQLATLEEGDVRLLQFLGKHYLGQSDATGETGTTEPVKTYQNVRIEDV